jgi:hypothetical protein
MGILQKVDPSKVNPSNFFAFLLVAQLFDIFNSFDGL